MIEIHVRRNTARRKILCQVVYLFVYVWLTCFTECPTSFQVFTTAAADERKNIVLLAFETMEKIVREYFSYITETEATTFTDCVRCLITFTNSKFTSDVSLNAIAFLRFCALKLADGGLVWNEKGRSSSPGTPVIDDNALNTQTFMDADENISYWVPLLTGTFYYNSNL